MGTEGDEQGREQGEARSATRDEQGGTRGGTREEKGGTRGDTRQEEGGAQGATRETQGGAQSDTHEEIMGATYRALCKHGYAHLTMQDIADEFDKSRSLLHYHYDTKDELMLAFLDNVIGWIGARLAESDTEEPLERLEEYVEKFVIDPEEESQETFGLALLELRLQAVHNEAYREKLAAHYRSNVDTVARIVADGVDASVFRPVDPDATGEAIYTAMVGARMYQVTLGAEDATRNMADALATFVVEDLLVEA